MSRVNDSRFVAKYCNEKLAWHGRDDDFIDLHKWKEFDKDKDFYINNIKITFFPKIYRDIGFRTKPGSLKKILKLSKSELENFNEDI